LIDNLITQPEEHDLFRTYDSIFDVDVGDIVRLQGVTAKCDQCGAFVLGATFLAVAGPIQMDFVTGKTRRLFLYIESPMCDCSSGLWLEQPERVENEHA
jgi:hypothetical protein